MHFCLKEENRKINFNFQCQQNDSPTNFIFLLVFDDFDFDVLKFARDFPLKSQVIKIYFTFHVKPTSRDIFDSFK